VFLNRFMRGYVAGKKGVSPSSAGLAYGKTNRELPCPLLSRKAARRRNGHHMNSGDKWVSWLHKEEYAEKKR
jgi:hypothetical protein